MDEIKQASISEMEGYDEVIKEYKYANGLRIRVWAKKGTKKRLYEYDAGMSESISDTTITVIYTFNQNIFAVASDRNNRFKYIENLFN